MIAACLLAFRNLPFHNLDVTSSVSTSKLVVHHRSGSVHVRIVGSRHIALANALILVSLHKGKLTVLHKVRSLVCAHPSTNLCSIGTLSVNDSSHRRVELTIHLLHSAIHSECLLLVKAVQLVLVCNLIGKSVLLNLIHGNIINGFIEIIHDVVDSLIHLILLRNLKEFFDSILHSLQDRTVAFSFKFMCGIQNFIPDRQVHRLSLSGVCHLSSQLVSISQTIRFFLEAFLIILYPIIDFEDCLNTLYLLRSQHALSLTFLNEIDSTHCSLMNHFMQNNSRCGVVWSLGFCQTINIQINVSIDVCCTRSLFGTLFANLECNAETFVYIENSLEEFSLCFISICFFKYSFSGFKCERSSWLQSPSLSEILCSSVSIGKFSVSDGENGLIILQ